MLPLLAMPRYAGVAVVLLYVCADIVAVALRQKDNGMSAPLRAIAYVSRLKQSSSRQSSILSFSTLQFPMVGSEENGKKVPD